MYQGPRRTPIKPEEDSPQTSQRVKTTQQTGEYRQSGYTSRRRARNIVSRAKTCVRCRLYKKKAGHISTTSRTQPNCQQCVPNPIDPSSSCLSCLRLSQNIPSTRVLCLRHEIQHASLFRDQDHPWQGFSKRWTAMKMEDIRNWDPFNNETKVVVITHGYGDAKYSLELRRFLPEDADIVEKAWMHGSIRKTHYIPPYGIINMQAAADELQRYTNRAVIPFVRTIIGKSDELFQQTYTYAIWWRQTAPVGPIEPMTAS